MQVETSQMCLEDDINCPAAQLYNGQIQAYFLALGRGGRDLAGYDPIWFYVHSYFETHAIDGDTFLSDRLNLIGNWYRQQNNSTEELRLANNKTAKWILDLMMEPDMQDYQNFFQRVSALEAALVQNPNLLLNNDCNQLFEWHGGCVSSSVF